MGRGRPIPVITHGKTSEPDYDVMDNLRKSLNEYGSRVVKTARDNLVKDKVNASGRLSKSLRHWVRETKTQTVVTFGASYPGNRYALFADQGRGAGKMPPIKAIEQWIKEKPLTIQRRGGKKMSVRSLAFVIARKIGEKGTGKPPSEFYTKAIEENEPELEKIGRAFAEDMRVLLRKPLKR